MSNDRPTTHGQASNRLAESFGMERHEAQRDLGPSMLEGLLSNGLAVEDRREDYITLTDAGRRCATAHRDPMAGAKEE